MSRRLLLLLVLGPLTACSRCGPSSAPDAAVSAPVRRSTDLRSAYTAMFPEHRGVGVLSSRATLTRTLRGELTDLHAQLDAPLGTMGFSLEPSTDGLLARRAPFVFEARRVPGGAELSVWLDIKEEEVGRSLMAPASLSTDSMALWFPSLPGLAVDHEDYELLLVWQAAFDERPWFILRQLTAGATASGWKLNPSQPFVAGEKLSDGGAAPIPDPLDFDLLEPNTGARVAVHREGRAVTVRYLLRTIDPGAR